MFYPEGLVDIALEKSFIPKLPFFLLHRCVQKIEIVICKIFSPLLFYNFDQRLKSFFKVCFALPQINSGIHSPKFFF